MVLDVDFTHICLFVDLVSFQLDFDHDIFLSLYLGGSLVPFGTLGLFRYDLEVKFDLVYLEKIFLYRAFAALICVSYAHALVYLFRFYLYSFSLWLLSPLQIFDSFPQ